MDGISLIFKSLEFAAGRHRKQFRKGSDKSPYINHPIQVATLLVNQAGEKDPVLLSAAILHDVIEDTVHTEKEKQELIDQIEQEFGKDVLALTLEVTDDKSLEKKERKRQQVLHAPLLSDNAKKLKIADKIMNLRDIYTNPPENWPLQRIIEYHDWAGQVIAGMRGVNKILEDIFDETMEKGRGKYQNKAQP
jgi:GTP diphosphokinase / guanosine-3',5'-bis(diphosphate) 3'-diphosphatase